MTKRRLKLCVEAWPGCVSGGYHPSCCRFPKSCSCDIYDPDRVPEEDLEPQPDQPQSAPPSRQLAHYQACALHLAREATSLLPQLRSIAGRVSLEDQMVLARIIAAAEAVADATNGRTGS